MADPQQARADEVTADYLQVKEKPSRNQRNATKFAEEKKELRFHLMGSLRNWTIELDLASLEQGHDQVG